MTANSTHTVKLSNIFLSFRCHNPLSPTFLFLSEGQQPLFSSCIIPVSRISFPSNFACLRIVKTYHSDLTQVFNHHCHHPLLLLTSTPGSRLIFSTNPFLHSSSTFHPPDWLHGIQLFFVFLGHVGFNFGTVC